MKHTPEGAGTRRVATYRRLGELHEAEGHLADAIKWYQQFVNAWKDGDAWLRPQVDEVRRRIARLQAAEAANR